MTAGSCSCRVSGSRRRDRPPRSTAPPNAETIDLPGTTLLPGLIEAHSHVLLHPYNETPWNDQVEHELLGLRISRATVSLKATLEAGFTTIRDLGTEGAGYADVGLKQAVNQGIIPGPAHARRRHAPSSRPERTHRKDSRPSGTCRRAARKSTASST